MNVCLGFFVPAARYRVYWEFVNCVRVLSITPFGISPLYSRFSSFTNLLQKPRHSGL